MGVKLKEGWENLLACQLKRIKIWFSYPPIQFQLIVVRRRFQRGSLSPLLPFPSGVALPPFPVDPILHFRIRSSSMTSSSGWSSKESVDHSMESRSWDAVCWSTLSSLLSLMPLTCSPSATEMNEWTRKLVVPGQLPRRVLLLHLRLHRHGLLLLLFPSSSSSYSSEGTDMKSFLLELLNRPSNDTVHPGS